MAKLMKVLIALILASLCSGCMFEAQRATVCLPEQREVDACIEIYQPVCATVIVQCVTTPCDPVQETFANSCKACMNSLVRTYANGECPVNQ